MTHGDSEITRLVRDAMREAVPEPSTKARVLASLRAEIAVAPVVAGTAAATGGAVKIAIVVAAAALGTTLVGVWPRGESTSAARTQAPARVEAPVSDRAPVVVPPAAELPPSPTVVAPPAPAPAPRITPPTKPRAIAPAPEEEEDPLFAESALVGRARALVDTAPAEALELCAAHAKEFPGGQLAIEREAIAVFARCARADANAAGAAEDFLAAHATHTAAAEVRRRCAKILGAE